MKCHYRKGFTLIEVIMGFNILFIVVGIMLYCFSNSVYYKKEQNIYGNAYLMTYNIIQIIKSDSYFYLHPENYFEDASENIEVSSSSSLVDFNLYFDEFNKLVQGGDHVYVIEIRVNLYSSKINYSVDSKLNYKIYNNNSMNTYFVISKYEE